MCDGKSKGHNKRKIRVASGRYHTYLVEPHLEHIDEVFQKSKNAQLKIWVTADKRRFPVKIKSEVKVGSFVGELISVSKSDPDVNWTIYRLKARKAELTQPK